MPIRRVIGHVHPCWAVCAMCSFAFAIISLKNTYFFYVYETVQLKLENNSSSTGVCQEVIFCRGSPKLTLQTPRDLKIDEYERLSDYVYWAGRLLSLVPAGVLSDIGFSKYVLGGGMLLIAAHHVALPVVARLCGACYALQYLLDGVGESAVLPSVMVIVSRASPPATRNTFIFLVVAGSYIGFVFGYLFFIEVVLPYGSWSFGNYAIGTLGVVWSVLWYSLVFCTYYGKRLQQSRHEYYARNASRLSIHLRITFLRMERIPWRRICCSRPLIILVLVYCFCLKRADYSDFLNFLGPYYRIVLRLPPCLSSYINVTQLSILPSALMAALVSDWADKHDVASKTVVKRTFVFVGVFCSSVLQMALTLVGCDVTLFPVLVVVSLYFLGFAVPAVLSSPIDLSPRYAGLLMAIMSGCSAACGLFDLRSIQTFDVFNRINGIIASTFNVLAILMMIGYLLFGSGEIQPWNRHLFPCKDEMDTPNTFVDYCH